SSLGRTGRRRTCCSCNRARRLPILDGGGHQCGWGFSHTDALVWEAEVNAETQRCRGAETERNMIPKLEILTRITDAGLVAIVRTETAERALSIAEAIQAGGCPAVEVT